MRLPECPSIGQIDHVRSRRARRGREAARYSADISSISGLLEVANHIKADLKHVDIPVQNAAMYAAGSIEDAGLADFD